MAKFSLLLSSQLVSAPSNYFDVFVPSFFLCLLSLGFNPKATTTSVGKNVH